MLSNKKREEKQNETKFQYETLKEAMLHHLSYVNMHL